MTELWRKDSHMRSNPVPELFTGPLLRNDLTSATRQATELLRGCTPDEILNAAETDLAETPWNAAPL
jgi:hypothetical protein